MAAKIFSVPENDRQRRQLKWRRVGNSNVKLSLIIDEDDAEDAISDTEGLGK